MGKINTFNFGSEIALQTAMHKAAMPALYGEAVVTCDVTGCGAVAEEGTSYCEDHPACRVCGAICCESKRCNYDGGR